MVGKWRRSEGGERVDFRLYLVVVFFLGEVREERYLRSIVYLLIFLWIVMVVLIVDPSKKTRSQMTLLPVSPTTGIVLNFPFPTRSRYNNT